MRARTTRKRDVRAAAATATATPKPKPASPSSPTRARRGHHHHPVAVAFPSPPSPLPLSNPLCALLDSLLPRACAHPAPQPCSTSLLFWARNQLRPRHSPCSSLMAASRSSSMLAGTRLLMLRSSRSSRGTNPCHELALLLPALSRACCTQCNKSVLTINTQTNSNPFLRSSHPRNNRSSRCIRPLLQAFSALHPHTNIRHHPCHLSRPHPSPGSLLLYSSCIIYHP